MARVQSIAKAGGIELIEIAEDNGESALDMRRPGLSRVLAAAAERRIGVVVVEDLARLARDPDDLQYILDSLRSSGVVVMHGVG